VAAFRFRLQILLDQKLEAKKQAEEELAKRQAELASEQAALADLQRRAESLAQKHQDARRELAHMNSTSGQDLLSYSAHVDSLGQDVESARDAAFAQEVLLDEFKEKVDEARAVLAERSREAEILTKYKDKLERRFQRQVEQKEELEQDEIGNMLYLSRRHAQ
jgi:flagellar biosynthesis chaperone FliJ